MRRRLRRWGLCRRRSVQEVTVRKSMSPMRDIEHGGWDLLGVTVRTRRGFVRQLGSGALVAWIGRQTAAQALTAALPALAGAGRGALRLGSGAVLAAVPPRFTGLGYEESSAALAGLFRPGNTAHVRMVRQLGPCVLRLGGIVADFTHYEADGAPRHDAKDTVITRENLQGLRGFADAVDARVTRRSGRR